jgi:polar amino acid transport system substrate-binding protein
VVSVQTSPVPPRAFAIPDLDAINSLAPTGVLRAGINLSNSLLVSGTEPTGEPRGVSPSMAAAVSDALGVPLQLVLFDGPGDLADAVTSDRWDIGNIGADPARAARIAFTSPYCEIESTYLVREDSPMLTAADADRPGVRIISKRRAAYTLWLERNIEHAKLIQTDTSDNCLDALAAEEVDVLAGLRPRLLIDAERIPASRVLEGRFASVQQAIGTPSDRSPAGLAFLQRFVVVAIDEGFVAALVEHYDVKGLLVAPTP